MKKGVVFLLIVCLTSCKYFDAKKIASETILNQELKTFNWNAVDTYPTFSVCDTLDTKTDKKTCFENTLSQHITTSLQNETIIVSQDIEDTLILEFQILETGDISITNIVLSEITETEIPEIRSIILKSLSTLPQIFPAIKREQPVKTAFKLPIVIAVN